ncbi:MAG: malto-oligosyltrehalose synthase [Solirubrobacterales bacterium]|nr:malto-oligosyltrehalose synthase [Solirubrobacterales bacterium]MBV9715062.1 malto-oligosyltrehalose synthase [Solirubrobacterales bacterium]
MSEPRATYRLQLTSDFGFASARSLVPYLRDLGISHLYLSPSFQARPGSTHGYDVVDPARFSDALGGEEEFRRLSAEAHDAGMGVLLDVVPNHMGADDANRYWENPELREKFFDVDPRTGRHRRFFDIDELAAIRQEDPDVFEATHAFALSLVHEGLVDGLRVDHPDGLADPAGYLVRLCERGAQRVWVEKILDPGERLRDWRVSGTVGYEFLNDVCALFVDPAAEAPLTSLWERVSGDRRGFGEVALEAKLEQARGTFAPELERLARELGDTDFPGGREALQRAVASLPVYRTYVEPWSGRVDDEDRRAIAQAEMPAELAEMLLLERDAPAAFVTRFQQTSPAVMAKGVEDTAFYRYGRLLALNDVGGDPSRFGIDVERFHAGNRERAERFPLNLLTTMTHDAKRSADVRSRIAALSWLPEEWAAHVERWFSATDALCSGGAPDDVERYFIFQTLLGAWPFELERLQGYMEKALREAKRNTNWIDQNADWEHAVGRFCVALYGDRAFLEDFQPFAARVAAAAERAMLGQIVLKLTVPGIPDIYQGDELPFRALVDPDNRRPVDWHWHQAMLRRLMGGSPPDSETRKLFVTLRLLGLRARRPGAFLSGAYEPVDGGSRACAFTRDGDVLVVVVPHGDVDDGTLQAPSGRWRDVLHGDERSFAGPTPIGEVVDEHGIAVFERA